MSEKVVELKTYKARFLIQFDAKTLEGMLTGEFKLQFDDGAVLATNAAETVYSAQAWEFFRRWPRTPFLQTHHLSYYLQNGKPFGDGPDRDYVSAIMNSVLDTYGQEANISDVKELSYQVQNNNYNEAISITATDVGTIDLEDFYDLYNHPAITKEREHLFSNAGKTNDLGLLVQSATANIKKILLTDETLSDNIIAISCRNGNMKTNQVIHCLGPIGFVYDADNWAFPRPILTGFYDGVDSLADALAASREPTVSIGNNSKTIQDTQYFSRSNGLNVNYFGNIIKYHDCGTKFRFPWVIDDKGRDLTLMDGTEYVDADGEVGFIDPSKKHLIGKLIYIRTLFGCMVEKAATACAACYGRAARVLPDNANVSVTPIADVGNKMTSSVLALKHDQIVSITNALDNLSPEQQTFFKVFPDKKSLGLKDALKDAQSFRLLINAEECETLASLSQLNGIDSIQISANSAVQRIVLEINDVMYPVDVGTEKQPAFLTREFLEYAAGVSIGKNTEDTASDSDEDFESDEDEEVLEDEEVEATDMRVEATGASHMEIDEFQRYVIDMSDWDFNLPFVETSSRGTGLLGLKMKIMAILQSKAVEADARDTRSAALAALVRLYEALNSAGNYSFPVVQTIVFGACIESHAERKYGLPKPWTKAGIGVANIVTKHRAMSNALAFEEQRTMLTDWTTYLIKNRPDNAYDALFVPGEYFSGKDQGS